MELATSIVRRVQNTAEKKGRKMSQVALAWISKRVSSSIIGFTSLEEMEEALSLRGRVLPKEKINILKSCTSLGKLLGISPHLENSNLSVYPRAITRKGHE